MRKLFSMKRILRSDWLPERTRLTRLARISPVRKKLFLLTKLVLSRRLDIVLVLYCVFID